jgi:hypothetical protein
MPSPSWTWADRIADDPDSAWCVREDIGYGSADREVSPKALAVGQAQDQQVGRPLGSLVDQGSPDVTRLEQDRLDSLVLGFSDSLDRVEDPLGILGPARDIRLEGQAPVDLDDVDRDQLGLGRPSRLARDSDDPGIARAAVDCEDATPKRRFVMVGHGVHDTTAIGA